MRRLHLHIMFLLEVFWWNCLLIVCLVVILAGVELSGNYNVLTQISSLSFEIYNSRSVNRIVLQYTSNLIHCIYMTTDLLT